MEKKIILIGTLLMSGIVFSQIGINTSTPTSTLDVVGKATDANVLDGITAPRLTGAQLRAKTYTAAQTGTLVYVTNADPAPAGQTVNVNSTGHFYFDGSVWKKVGNINIYNTDGSLTGNRNLNLNTYSLNFGGSQQYTAWDPTGGMNQYGVAGIKRSSFGLIAKDNNGNGLDSVLYLFQDPENYAQIVAGADSSGLVIGTAQTTLPSAVKFSTSAGGSALATEKMIITSTGNVGINKGVPAELLDVGGAVKISTAYSSSTISANATAPTPTGGAGTIVFQNSHFFGWNGSMWKQLDN